jgi:hypothetical protein
VLQFFKEDPMLLPHPADELSLTLEQPADEAFPSNHIKFGHMKTSINGQPSSPAQQYKM